MLGAAGPVAGGKDCNFGSAELAAAVVDYQKPRVKSVAGL